MISSNLGSNSLACSRENVRSDEPVAVDVDPTTHAVYVGNEGADNVSVISGSTNRVIATVGVGHEPDALGVDPSTHRAYVANEANDTVSVISRRPC